MVNGSWLMAQGSHEPITTNNRLINELFDYVLQVLGIRYYPKFQNFKVANQSSNIPKFQSSKNSRFQDSKISTFQIPNNSMFQILKCPYFQITNFPK